MKHKVGGQKIDIENNVNAGQILFCIIDGKTKLLEMEKKDALNKHRKAILKQLKPMVKKGYLKRNEKTKEYSINDKKLFEYFNKKFGIEYLSKQSSKSIRNMLILEGFNLFKISFSINQLGYCLSFITTVAIESIEQEEKRMKQVLLIPWHESEKIRLSFKKKEEIKKRLGKKGNS